MSKKIISCYYEVNGNKFVVSDGSAVLMEIGKNHRFYINVNEKENFGTDYVISESRKNFKVKWAYILQYNFSNLEKDNKEQNIWGYFIEENGSTSVEKYGIGKKYLQGNHIEFLIDKNEKLWEGSSYKMLLFIDKPEDGISFAFMPVKSKPEIRGFYFDKQNIIENSTDFNLYDGYYNYGSTIKLYLSTHMLPLAGLPDAENVISNGIDIDLGAKYKDLKITIDLLDESSDKQTEKKIKNFDCGDSFKPVLDKPLYSEKLSKFLKDQKTQTANNEFIIPIIIDLDWRNNLHKNHEEQPTKKYSVMVVIENTRTGHKDFAQPLKSKWWKSVGNDIEEIPSNHFFAVKYNTVDYILKELEEIKNNMIQYIGDIEYTKKENNPCAYSVITVNNGSKDFDVFHEYKFSQKTGDQTDKFIDIVNGDEDAKTVIVTAKFINPKTKKREAVRTQKNNHKCEKILNDGKPHNGIYDVFKMEWIVGQWVPSKDPALFAENYKKMIGVLNVPSFHHPSNANSAPRLNWDKSDQDAKGIETSKENQKIFKAITVAGVQGLSEQNYTIVENSDSISLQLKYIYNKTVVENIQKYIGTAINKVWIFNYFTLQEKHAQIYFVPVTTCRYPNQVVKFRVFPDMQWGITFSIGAVKPKDKEDWKESLTVERKKVLEEYKGAFNYASSDSAKQAEISKKQAILNKLDLKLGFTASAGAEEFELTVDFSDKIKDVVYSFGLIKEIFDTVAGNGETAPSSIKKELKYLASAKKSKYFKGLTKLPIEIVVDNPALSCGFAWGFRQVASKNKVTKSYDIFIKASPIISATGTLDLIALAVYIPVFGQALKVVDIVLEASGIDASFFISAKGKIDFGLTLKLGEDDSLSEGDLGFNGDFMIRVEASITIKGGIVGFLFAAGDWKGDKVTEYRAYGETGLTGTLKAGADAEGPYIDANISFAGLIFVAEKKQSDDELGTSKTEKIGPYIVIKEAILIGNKYYLNKENEKIN